MSGSKDPMCDLEELKKVLENKSDKAEDILKKAKQESK